MSFKEKEEKMHIVLLSGGSGKRLWPLSNEVRSKQFLKLIKTENGEVDSMVRRVYEQISSAIPNADISVATSATQVEAIKNQLGSKVSIIVEPQRRNTFPAIALASAYLYYEKHCDPDETVTVLPVDPYVDSEYFCTLLKLDKTVQSAAADIVLMGVKPTYPSEKYGYIIPQNTDVEPSPVSQFKEKPDSVAAQKFIDMGGLWNCGVFAFKLSYMLDIVRQTVPSGSYADVINNYSSFEKTSFDYAVLEKADSVAVVPYSGEWKDLGTWNTITEVMDPLYGFAIASDDCENTHVINELEIPIVVMGAHDMIVAAGPDGILVADKEQSSYIKKYVENMDIRPMYEEREWGDYTVLNVSVDETGNKAVTKKKTVKKNSEIKEKIHTTNRTVWTVLSGKAVIRINGRNHDAFPGDTYTIDKGITHSLTALEDTVILEVQIGA